MAPIHNAAFSGNLNRVKALLNQGVPVNARDERNGATPLHEAVASGRLRIVQELLKRGAHVNPRTSSGMTPLHLAAQNGRLNVVQELLKRGAHVNPRAINGFTPLMAASFSERPHIVHALIKAGANPRYANVYGIRAFGYASEPTRNTLSTSRAALKWQNTTRKRKAERMLLSPRLLGSTKLNSKSISNIARYLTVKKV